MAQAMTRAGNRAYLYHFSYTETGKRAHLGAYHGEELMFLSNSFSSDWEHDRDDERLGKIMRSYWAQFAKTGNPNAPRLPAWPAYNSGLDQCMDLARTIRVRSIPDKGQFRILEGHHETNLRRNDE
jgi:para-nitrobenzyl esterase